MANRIVSVGPTRRDLWDGDICDYAAIQWVLGRSLQARADC